VQREIDAALQNLLNRMLYITRTTLISNSISIADGDRQMDLSRCQLQLCVFTLDIIGLYTAPTDVL